MSKMIACCGMNCVECPAFIATKENDEMKKAEVAKMWSQAFQSEVKPKDIECDGCKSEGGRQSTHCRICGIKKCSTGKSLENCATCSDYGCDQLKFVTDSVPSAKEALDSIRNGSR